MKRLLFLALLVAAWAEEDVLPLAEPCDPEACQLPACRCSGTDIPGGLHPRDTPQFVLLTFDDGVNIVNIDSYRNLVYNRRNSNGCPVGTTYYINHEYTDYTLVNELYNQGFEIALHSISHQTPDTYWKEATYDDMKLEFGDQRRQMSHFANIPIDAIKGVRIPFLQMSGNSSFQVMTDFGLEYDCTMPTANQINPGLWPYTLDYASTQDCVIPECPSASIPGVWVLPLVSWVDLSGFICSMVDSCFSVPPLNDEEAWFEFIVTNFERHYKGNRSPFGFYVHEWYIASNPAIFRALGRFLDMVNNLQDAFLVNSAEVLDWVKDPVPVPEYRSRPCKSWVSTACPRQSCGPLTSDHNVWGAYWMQICNTCPNTYPWLGNPLGE